MKKRDSYFDFLRGIAIIFVVGIHTLSGYGFDNLGEIFNVIVRQAIGCAVPMFLAISGYFIAKKDLSTKTAYFSFLKRQVPKVYVPVLIYSLPFLAIAIYQGDNLAVQLLLYLCCGYSIYYFIALIIQYYALTPLLSRIKRGGVIVCALISLISISGITYLLKIEAVRLPLIVYAGAFPVWIVFYALGCYIGRTGLTRNLTLWIALSIIGVIASVIESQYLLQYAPSYGIKPSAFFYSLCIIMVMFNERIHNGFKENSLTKAIAWLGKVSFAVYLTHCFLILPLSRTLISNGYLLWIVTLALDSILIAAAIKLLPKTICTKIGIIPA